MSFDSVTNRQSQIISLAAQGKTDKEIASDLNVQLSTVHSHWKSIRERLGASSRTEALARVLIESAEKDKILKQSEVEELLFQLAEANRLRQQLKEANERLRQIGLAQAEFASQSVSDATKRQSGLLARLGHLEALNEMCHRTRTVLHNGEYGLSWHKHFMSESVEFTGTNASQWMSGEVTFFDFMHPEFVVRNLTQFAPVSEGVHRLCLTYYVQTPEGPRQMLDFLTCTVTASDGTGQYYGVTIDVSEWVEPLLDLVNRGHLDLSTLIDTPVESPPA